MKAMKIHFKPVLEIALSTLMNAIRTDGCTKVVQHLESEWKKMANAVDYPWGGANLKFSDGNAPMYAYHLWQSSGNWIMSVWDVAGMTSLGAYSLNESGFNNGEYVRLRAVLDAWAVGCLPCSQCGDLINYQENKSRFYYAGTYCEECWESGMRAKAANENYD